MSKQGRKTRCSRATWISGTPPHWRTRIRWSASGMVGADEIRAGVLVDGRRWRRLDSAQALAALSPAAEGFILDSDSGVVRFGNGKHGRQAPLGSRARVSFRQGAGASEVVATWVGHSPPRPFALAAQLAPRSL